MGKINLLEITDDFIGTEAYKKHYCTDMFGFEILGMFDAKTDAERIECLKHHASLLEGLYNEAISKIENTIFDFKTRKK